MDSERSFTDTYHAVLVPSMQTQIPKLVTMKYFTQQFRETDIHGNGKDDLVSTWFACGSKYS